MVRARKSAGSEMKRKKDTIDKGTRAAVIASAIY
jgi:hypothetical protein